MHILDLKFQEVLSSCEDDNNSQQKRLIQFGVLSRLSAKDKKINREVEKTKGDPCAGFPSLMIIF
jgi:hypothetical protein